MTVRLIIGDCRERLAQIEPKSVNCCVTSPPYFGLRDYGHAGQIGLEETPDAFVAQMVEVFRGVHRALRDDGTLWLNLGDSYGNKQLLGMPWRVAFALQADGWFLRSEIIWAKPNGMPGSQTDRCTSSHETVFLLSKSAAYWSDFDAIKTPPRESTLIRTAQDTQAQAGSHRANGGGKTNGAMKAVGGVDKQRGHSRTHAGFNARWDAMDKAEQMSKPAMMRDVWFISPAQSSEAHFAQMPEELARRCVLAGCPSGGVVLDPFGGAGTTGAAADRLQRNAVLIELNPEYAAIAERRLHADAGMFAEVAA